jgi:hypothetical protein
MVSVFIIAPVVEAEVDTNNAAASLPPPAPRHGVLPTVPIVLSSDEQVALERLCRSGRTAHRVAMRARAILLAAVGWQNDAIARELHRHHTWVRKWRKRFAHDRLASLYDRPRSGRSRRLSPPATGEGRRIGLHRT